MPFHVAVAVSPFKYLEADCVYQYVKLEKKIAAGADCAITQVGWDAEKFRELRRYMDERGLRAPVLGNVYVLTPRAAERMANGQPPGCWVSPALLDACAPSRPRPTAAVAPGSSARPERWRCCAGSGTPARTSGAPTTPPTSRGSSAGPRSWRRTGSESPSELRFGDADGFYLYQRRRRGRPSARAGQAGPIAEARPRRDR